MTEIKFLVIDSKNRLSHSPSSTNAFFQFAPINATSVEVVYLQLPMTSYNINSTNNIVYFFDTVLRNFAITIGNYDVYTFIAELQSKFNSVSSGYTVTYSDVSMKLTIRNTINFQLLFGTYTTNSSAYIMGFNNTNTSLALSQLSNNCINLSLPLYICCDITELGISCKTTDNTCTVFVFPNKVNIGDILSYSENTDYKMCSGGEQIF